MHRDSTNAGVRRRLSWMARLRMAALRYSYATGDAWVRAVVCGWCRNRKPRECWSSQACSALRGLRTAEVHQWRSGGGNIGDLFGGLFGRGAQPRPSRPRRGNDLETETELDFLEATKGVAMPLRLTSPAPCTNCHGSGARPGTSPKVCPTCNGAGVINRNQGAFGFSEPCTECRGSGSIIEHPCDECKGTGVTTRTRTINVRIPPGVEDGQRIRLAGQGEAGLRGAPSGDLYVTVHVRPDKVFGRDGDDLTVSVPVSFSELALGTTLSVPTLDGKVGVRVPKGTADGRILRVRGRGVPKRSGGQGDLLVTVKVAVPPNLEGAAKEALEAYAVAERSSGFDPRAGWAGNR